MARICLINPRFPTSFWGLNHGMPLLGKPRPPYAFPLGDDGLVNGPRRTLIDFGDEEGSDGMTVDVKGNVYLAARSPKRPGILVLDPAGKELAYIATGEPQPHDAKEFKGMPSNCDFGIDGGTIASR